MDWVTLPSNKLPEYCEDCLLTIEFPDESRQTIVGFLKRRYPEIEWDTEVGLSHHVKVVAWAYLPEPKKPTNLKETGSNDYFHTFFEDDPFVSFTKYPHCIELQFGNDFEIAHVKVKEEVAKELQEILNDVLD